MARKRLIAAGAVCAAALVAGSIAVVVTQPSDEEEQPVQVTASSTADGSDPTNLLTAGEESSREAAWTSDAETEGAWLQIDWPHDVTVDHLRLRSAGDPATDFRAATLMFGDGSSLHVAPDDDGNVAIDFSERVVSTVRMTFAEVPDEAKSVSLASWSSMIE